MDWEWHKGQNLTYLKIPEWEKQGVQLGFSSRNGGTSSYPFDSLNLGLHVGDMPEDVLENRRLWLQEWRAGWSDFAVGEQIHGTEIRWLDDSHRGLGSRGLENAVAGVDGLLTQSSLGLMAFFADCVPLFFYHPKIKAVGIAHAGWKGTVGKIGSRVIEEFAKAGGKAEECWAALGPSIGPCCYEIDERVAELVNGSFGRNNFLQPARSGHYMLDLWEANRKILTDGGIKAENISMASSCTACHNDEFFSHRKHAPTGRMAGWIRLINRD